MSDQLSVADITWRDFPAWLVAGPELEVVLTVIGGQLAALRGPGDALNPLWQPLWPMARAGEGDPSIFGDSDEANLLPVIVGSFACIDRFGAPHPGEDKPVHGEAKEMDHVGGLVDGDCFEAVADCPRTGIRVRRRLRIVGPRVSLETTVCHDDATARAVEWCEHLTLGDPFLDGVEISAAATEAWANVEAPETPRRFAEDAPLARRSAAEVLEMPTIDSPPVGDIYALAPDEGWIEAVNHRLGRRLRLAWDVAEFPWCCVWTEHCAREHQPWNGLTRARGLEISTKPFPEGQPPADRFPTFAGRSTRCEVPPGVDGLTKTIVLEWARDD